MAPKRKKSSSNGKPAKRMKPRALFKAKRTVKVGGGGSGIELKFHDATKGSTVLPSTIAGGELDPVTANCVNGIGQGDTESTRDGRKYTMKQVQVNGIVEGQTTQDAADVIAATAGWVALVLDTQTNQAQLNSEDVYVGTEVELPFRNLAWAKRFKVLAFEQIVFDTPPSGNDSATTQTNGSRAFHFHWNKPLDIPVLTTGTGATVANIADNSLHVIGASDAASLYIKYNSRVRFVG